MEQDFDSVSRLSHLARVAEAKATEARDLQNRRNSVSQMIGHKRREQSAFAPNDINRDETRFAEFGVEIKALESERDDLDRAFSIASASATDALRLHDECDAFASQAGLPRPSIFSSRNSGGAIA